MGKRWGGLAFVISFAAFVGCTRQPAPGEQDKAQVQVDPKTGLKLEAKEITPGEVLKDPSKPAASDELRDKYEAALADALNLLADQKWQPALVALETARAFQDNEFIRGEIERLKARLDRDAAAQKTLQNLETILDEGKGAEAAKLAKQALDELGGDDLSPKLVKLRLQADALATAEKKEDAQASHDRYRAEGDAALREQNLRAAALAFDQALAARADAGVKEQLDEVRAKLESYDGLRKKAAELRRNPHQLEDALDALREAAKAWDTLAVRQEIDDVSLALQNRRDSLSVADFEVRGDVGLADAGRAFAEELLPHFKSRFDLVERGQIDKIIAELKLEDNLTDDFASQREVGNLARVRYLVVGSFHRAAGVTVNARLVDVKSGLVVQTAKITAATAEEALTQLPELAKQLLMNDEEKLAYEQQQLRLAKRIEPIAADAPLPPAPPAPVADLPPPPPLFVEAPAVELGGLGVRHFQALPPPPPPGKVMPLPVHGGAIEIGLKTRLAHVALELGDNHFRRGHFHEARRHFDFALQLAPGHVGIGLRLERVAPHVPPPPVVIVERPAIVVRPRIAILNFATIGDPRLLAPELGSWTAYQMAPYFAPYYDIVDPAEVYWYMGRLGMTLRDLMEDPHARRWLGRALGLRSFVLGTIELGSLDVNAYLLDAEFGYLQGSGRIIARNPYELKLRLAELARLTMMDPVERARLLAEADRFDALLLRGRQCLDRHEFSVAVTIFEDALKLRPGHVQVMFHLHQARGHARRLTWEEERRRQLAARLAAENAARRRQWELARATEAARLRAVQEAALRAEEERRLEEIRRRSAANALVVQAQVAIKAKNFTLALSFFEGALGLRPQDDVILRDLAAARAEADRAAQARAAQELALREEALRRQRQQELVLAQKQLDLQRQRELAAVDAQRKALEERDRLAYQAAFDEGQRLLNLKQFDGAIAALQTARRLKKTDAVEALLSRAFADQAYAQAEAQGKAEAAKIQEQLAQERLRRQQAEAQAKKNQKLYQDALKLGNDALAQKEFDVAEANYQKAGKLFQTDAVLTGLRQVESGRARMATEATAAKRKAQEESERSQRLKDLLSQGQAALDSKDYATAVKTFTQAKNVAPGNVEVLSGLTRAEQGRDRALAEARKKSEETGRAQNFQRLLKSGQDNLADKQYDAAVVVLTEALKLNPDDRAAKGALAQAEKARQAGLTDVKAREEARTKTEAYRKLVNDGQLALDSQRYDDAIGAFSAAQKLLPGDRLSAEALKEAQKAKQAAQEALASAAKKRAEEIERTGKVRMLIEQGRLAMGKKDLVAAEKAFEKAAQLAPKHADVERARADLRAAAQFVQAEESIRMKRAEKHQSLLAAGRKALAAKKYEEAVKALRDAAALVPDDKIGLALLDQAQKFLGEPAKDQTAYRAAMARGDKALTARKFQEAIDAYREAIKLSPDDKLAAALLRQTQEAWAAAKASSTKNQAEYLEAIETGQRAMTAKKYDDAFRSFSRALKLAPDDKKATQLLLQAQRGLDEAGASLKLQVAFNEALQMGQKAMTNKKYAAAVEAFRRAVKLMPSDQKAQQLLAQAQRALDDSGKASEDDTKKKAKERQQAFASWMKKAAAAMDAKQFGEAQKAYAEALKLFPDNSIAQRGVREATQALDNPKTKPNPKPEPKKSSEPKKSTFEQELDTARALEKQQKFAEALKSYQAALAISPKDAIAAAGLKRAEVGLHISEGQKHLEAKRYAEAVRSFEAALQIAPNNPMVQKLLKRAKEKK